MKHILKNVSGGNLNLGNIVLADNEELLFFDDDHDIVSNVEDIVISLNDIASDNLNRYFVDLEIEYIVDTVTQTSTDFYSFWNEFINITYVQLLEITPISRNSINEQVDGLVYDSTSGTLSILPDNTIVNNTEVNNWNTIYDWGSNFSGGFQTTSGVGDSLISVSNTDTTTNINDAGGIDVPLTGNLDLNSPDIFEINGDGIRIKRGGLALCIASVKYTTTVERANVNLQFKIDSTPQDARFAHGYIRSLSGHNESSITMIQWLYVNEDETVYVQSTQEGFTGTVTLLNQQSVFQIYKSANTSAKGEKGEPGEDGEDGQTAFNFLDGEGEPDDLLGIEGDIYIDSETNDFYRKDSATSWDYLSTLQTPFPNYTDRSIVPIWAEEGGGLSNNNTQWSFGNGAVGNIGILLPFNAKVLAVTFHAENAGASESQVAMTLDTVNTSAVVVKPPSTQTATLDITDNPLDVSIGQVLGFRTIIGGSASDVRVCAWLLIDNDEVLGNGSTSGLLLTNVDLNYIESGTNGIVESDSGSNAIIPAGRTDVASLMLPEDKQKLDTIDSIATQLQVNEATSGDTIVTPVTLLKGQPNGVATLNDSGLISATQLAGGGKSMILSFGSDVTYEVNANGIFYTKVATFIYAGSDDVGDITELFVNVWKTGGGTIDIRIYDATHAQVISELTGVNTTSELNFQSMGAVSNVPSVSSIFEIQIKRNAGGTTGFCGSVEIKY